MKLRLIGSAARRAFSGPQVVDLLGERFSVAYEARGMWTEPDYTIIKGLAQGKRCVYDVGANKGGVSLLMSSVLAPSGIVVAFEASEEACRIILTNAELNGISDRIHVVNALVGDDSTKTVGFYWDSSSVFASIIQSRTDAGHDAVCLYKPMLTLDDYTAQTNRSPGFIKIDVEGAEQIVIMGMLQVLTVHRPEVFVEVHELPGVSISASVVQILNTVHEVNYSVISLDPFQKITDGQLYQHARGRSFVLLLPDERDLSSFSNAAWLRPYQAAN